MLNTLKIRTLIFLISIIVLLSLFLDISFAQGGANLSLPFARRSLVKGTFGDGHYGIDYRALTGTEVVAARAGEVELIENEWEDDETVPPEAQEFGNHIVIDHGDGYKTIYAHLSQNSFQVAVGDTVKRGQYIARSDNTGSSTAPHLHFELQYNGAPVDPYDAAWVSRSPIPMGYRGHDQYGTVHGPYAIDRTKIHDKWLALNGEPGAPVENDWTSTCVPPRRNIRAALYIQGFERGYIQYCGSGSAEYIAYDKTYLPDARIDDDDWTSTVTARNNGASANITAFFRDEDGGVVDSRKYYNLLSGNAAWTLDGSDLADDWTNPVTDFDGSAVVVSSQDMSVVVEQERYRNGRYSYAATQGAPVNETSDTVHLPVVMRDFGGWRTFFYIQNVGDQASWVTVAYYAQDGQNPELTLYKYLQPNESVKLDQSDSEHSELKSNFNGSAKITALTGGTLLAVHLYEEHQTEPPFFSYAGFTSGSQTLHMPTLFSRGYGGWWSASFSLKNLSASPANVTIEFLADPEQSSQIYDCTDVQQISTSFSAWLPYYQDVGACNFPDGWVGSAEITSNQPLVGIVNQINEASSSNLAASHNAFGNGATTVILPYLTRNVNGWNGSFTLQNLGAGEAQITLRYYHNDTGQEVHSESVIAFQKNILTPAS